MKTRRTVSAVISMALTATVLGASEDLPASASLPKEAAAAGAQTAEREAPAAPEPTCGEGALCVGMRVRLRLRAVATQPLVGDVVSSDPESVDIRLARDRQAQIVRVSRDQVARIEALHGRKSLVGTGLLVGFVSAAAVGGLLGRTGHGLLGCDACSTAGDVALGAATLGSLGIVCGGIVGAIARTDHWKEVPTARWKPRISIAPGRRGARVALSVGF